MFKKDKLNIWVEDRIDKSPIRLDNLQEGSRNCFSFFLLDQHNARRIYLLPENVLEQYDKMIEDLLN